MTWSGVIAWPTRGNIAGRLKTDPQHRAFGAADHAARSLPSETLVTVDSAV
jgi:hypothetical protein